MKIHWLRRAETDIDRIYDYIALRSSAEMAFQVRFRIVQSVWRLAEFPESGRAGEAPGTRELIVTGLPYMLLYRIGKKGIFILRVFHMAQEASRYH